MSTEPKEKKETKASTGLDPATLSLFDAINEENFDKFQVAIKQKANLIVKAYSIGITPIRLALQKDDPRFLIALLKNRRVYKSVDLGFVWDFFTEVFKNNKIKFLSKVLESNIFKEFLSFEFEHNIVEQNIKIRLRPLLWAAFFRNEDAIRVMLAHGGNIDGSAGRFNADPVHRIVNKAELEQWKTEATKVIDPVIKFLRTTYEKYKQPQQKNTKSETQRAFDFFEDMVEQLFEAIEDLEAGVNKKKHADVELIKKIEAEIDLQLHKIAAILRIEGLSEVIVNNRRALSRVLEICETANLLSLIAEYPFIVEKMSDDELRFFISNCIKNIEEKNACILMHRLISNPYRMDAFERIVKVFPISELAAFLGAINLIYQTEFPLITAAKLKNAKIIKLFLHCGADVKKVEQWYALNKDKVSEETIQFLHAAMAEFQKEIPAEMPAKSESTIEIDGGIFATAIPLEITDSQQPEASAEQVLPLAESSSSTTTKSDQKREVFPDEEEDLTRLSACSTTKNGIDLLMSGYSRVDFMVKAKKGQVNKDGTRDIQFADVMRFFRVPSAAVMPKSNEPAATVTTTKGPITEVVETKESKKNKKKKKAKKKGGKQNDGRGPSVGGPKGCS